jgi:type IV pilus assembly protein PilE
MTVNMKQPPRRQSAFTLIEIMTVLLIISILSAFAYPSYRQARLKTARAEGRAALMQLMQQQERHYTQHHRYQRFAADDDTVSFQRFSGATAKAGAYRLDAQACAQADDQDCILLRAKPAPGFTDPLCDVLTLDSNGVQGAGIPGSGSANAGGCW